MIYLFTAPIRTGKTSALLKWVNNRNDVDGLLCPDDENGKRFFMQIKSKERFQLQAENTIGKESILIGSFVFLKSAFRKANTILITSGLAKSSDYLVIDELGKLELKNEGLHESAVILIPNYETDISAHLVLVVRDTLLDAIISHYDISKYKILKPSDLKS